MRASGVERIGSTSYPKRKSAAIPARHAFSNVPRVGTVIDKTIRKLPGLFGNYRKSQVGAKHATIFARSIDFSHYRKKIIGNKLQEKNKIM